MRPHLPLVVGACAAGLLPACTQAPEAPERPNVLFILLDDLAYDAIGSSGRYPFLETPNISRLQREGVTFSNFFCTMSLSSPSRACFLTGVYPHLHGVTQNDVRVDPLWDVYTPYPQLLQERGYETAFIGKMHNAELWAGSRSARDSTTGSDSAARETTSTPCSTTTAASSGPRVTSRTC